MQQGWKPGMIKIILAVVPCYILYSMASAQDPLNNPDPGNLSHYAAANASLPAPKANEQRVVFMGNSITEGWLLTDPSFFADKPYINRGISGQTTDQMLLRFRQDVIDLKPVVVVLLAGTNDIAQNQGPRTLEAIFNNIVAMAEMAKTNGIRIIICSVLPVIDYPWRPGLQPAEKILTLNRMLSDYCRAQQLTYLDYHTPMSDDQHGLQYRYGEDGVHPNLAGYRCMEPLVEAALQSVLKK